MSLDEAMRLRKKNAPKKKKPAAKRGTGGRAALTDFYTLLELVRVDTTCWRCFEQLSSPVVLWPCGHTF